MENSMMAASEEWQKAGGFEILTILSSILFSVKNVQNKVYNFSQKIIKGFIKNLVLKPIKKCRLY